MGSNDYKKPSYVSEGKIYMCDSIGGLNITL